MTSREDESRAEPTGSPTPIEMRSMDGVITLRQFAPQDAKEIFDLIDRNREHLSQHGEDTAEKYQTFESVLRSIESPSNPNRLRFAIRNEQGEFVGSINLTRDEGNSGKGEIGYYLGAEFTGSGYAARAVETLTRYGFKHLGYNEIFGVVAETNLPSLSVLRRFGYAETERRKSQDVEKIVLTRFKPPAPPSQF